MAVPSWLLPQPAPPEVRRMPEIEVRHALTALPFSLRAAEPYGWGLLANPIPPGRAPEPARQHWERIPATQSGSMIGVPPNHPAALGAAAEPVRLTGARFRRAARLHRHRVDRAQHRLQGRHVRVVSSTPSWTKSTLEPAALES